MPGWLVAATSNMQTTAKLYKAIDLFEDVYEACGQLADQGRIGLELRPAKCDVVELQGTPQSHGRAIPSGRDED